MAWSGLWYSFCCSLVEVVFYSWTLKLTLILITFFSLSSYGFGPSDELFLQSKGFAAPQSPHFLSIGGGGNSNERYLTVDYRHNSQLSENTYLIWSPLSTGIGYVFKNDRDERSLAEWSLNLRTHRAAGVVIGPAFDSGRVWESGGQIWILHFEYLLARPVQQDLFFSEVYGEFGVANRLNDKSIINASLKPRYNSLSDELLSVDSKKSYIKRYLQFDFQLQYSYQLAEFLIQPGFVDKLYWEPDQSLASSHFFELDFRWAF